MFSEGIEMNHWLEMGQNLVNLVFPRENKIWFYQDSNMQILSGVVLVQAQ